LEIKARHGELPQSGLVQSFFLEVRTGSHCVPLRISRHLALVRLGGEARPVDQVRPPPPRPVLELRVRLRPDRILPRPVDAVSLRVQACAPKC
jgi:hypothetical protein